MNPRLSASGDKACLRRLETAREAQLTGVPRIKREQYIEGYAACARGAARLS